MGLNELLIQHHQFYVTAIIPNAFVMRL